MTPNNNVKLLLEGGGGARSKIMIPRNKKKSTKKIKKYRCGFSQSDNKFNIQESTQRTEERIHTTPGCMHVVRTNADQFLQLK